MDIFGRGHYSAYYTSHALESKIFEKFSVTDSELCYKISHTHAHAHHTYTHSYTHTYKCSCIPHTLTHTIHTTHVHTQHTFIHTLTDARAHPTPYTS